MKQQYRISADKQANMSDPKELSALVTRQAHKQINYGALSKVLKIDTCIQSATDTGQAKLSRGDEARGVCQDK